MPPTKSTPPPTIPISPKMSPSPASPNISSKPSPPQLTRLSTIPSRIKHGISTWASECRAYNTEYASSLPLLTFMETCREAARIANSSTDGGKHAFMEKGEFEGLVREGREKELKGEGEVEEEREEWKVCGCKGCEKWGALKETSVLAY